jgi:septal ring factor EnvC (AmiA/AmiB activator)
MRTNKKIVLLLISPLLMLLQSGCQIPEKPVEVIIPPRPANSQQGDFVARKFQEPVSHGPTAVESAIELSEKYAKLSKDAAVLWQKNQDLVTRNRQLRERVTSLDSQLKQTQKELAEANDFLIEMRIELNNWKTNVLGYRDEMRDAEKAQLEALLEILKILGGEVKEESALSEDTGSTEGLPDELAQSQ